MDVGHLLGAGLSGEHLAHEQVAVLPAGLDELLARAGVDRLDPFPAGVSGLQAQPPVPADEELGGLPVLWTHAFSRA